MTRWILVAVLAATGCKTAPSADRCQQLLDKLIDLEFKKAGAAATSDAMKAEIASQKKAVSESRGSEFIETCVNKISRTRIECALSAVDLDAVARCDEAK